MDSKSIPRKGVGVRLPSLAPTTARRRTAELEAIAREVGLALWPRVRAELRAACADLERGRPLAALEHEELADRLGWCLGVVAAGHGIDLLLARREAEGLAWLCAEVARAVAVPLEPAPEGLPRIRGGDWRTALLAAWCVLRCARGGSAVRWHAPNGTALAFEDPTPAPDLGPRCRRLGGASGEPRLRREDARLVLTWS